MFNSVTKKIKLKNHRMCEINCFSDYIIIVFKLSSRDRTIKGQSDRNPLTLQINLGENVTGQTDDT